MSGVILLIGALAIGGRGLNLGIDFTSGTRITVGLDRSRRPQQQVSALTDRRQGVPNPRSRRSPGEDARANAYQISFKKLPSGARAQLRTALQSRFGIQNNGKDFNYTSVGPTFGKTVANSAVVAIIASLLVIAAYVALRFEWKFAVPVLIALMHDLLITAGVYALTGRQVTATTVAALLTIFGLLAVRHDHRVRPRTRERAADAARRVLADRQPLDVRGADAVAGDDLVHAAAGHRAAAVRRHDAARTSRSRCWSASRRAPTRRSSSPRRC